MSSILEALERAEQERNAREQAPRYEPLSKPKSLWQQPRVWLIGAGLLLLNLLVWWLTFDSVDAPLVARAPQAQATPAPRPAAQLPPPPQLQESTQMAESRLPPKTSPPPVVEPVVREKPLPTEPANHPAAQLPPPPRLPESPQMAESRVPLKTTPPPVMPPVVREKPLPAEQAKTARVNVPPLLEEVTMPAPATPAPAVTHAQPVARIPAVVPAATAEVASSNEVTALVETSDPIEPLTSPSVSGLSPGAEPPKSDTPAQTEVPEVSTPEPVVAQVTETAVETPVEKVERVPEIWELPGAEQQKFKDLKINIHVYNDIPAERFVIIDMRRYREGDDLARAGLKLESITREGVIINYGKGKVKM